MSIGTRLAAVVASLFFGLGTLAHALPAKVFVFNDNRDRTNQFAKNYIWQDLGLSSPDGEMGQIQANGDITLGGNKVGEVIKNGAGQVIGYKNADGSKEAYDVDKTTTNMAWMQVENDGCLVIMKHGGGTNGTTGGGIHLDNSQSFDGFKQQGSNSQGTGAGFRNNRNKQPSGAYPLTPRPGANIKITLYVCNGGTDPDGGGPKRSVGSTAGDVPGVGSVESYPRKLQGKIVPSFKSGDMTQQKAALRALKKCAKDAGFGNAKTDIDDPGINSWIMSLPASTRYSTVNNCIAHTGACIRLRYTTDPIVDVDDIDAFEPVQMFLPGFGGVYAINPPIAELSMSLVIEPGDLGMPELFQLDKLSADGPPPIGQWATGAWDLREMDYEGHTPGPLTYHIEYAGNPGLARPFQYDFGANMWVPVGPHSVIGNEVVLDLSGAHMVAIAEDARQAKALAVTAAQGSLVDSGIWDPDRSFVDAVIKSGGIVLFSNQKVSKLQVDYDGSAPGSFFDVRLAASVGASTGDLTIEALNRGTGLYETIGAFTMNQMLDGYRVENVPAAAYLNASRELSLRYKTVVAVPTVTSSVNTTFSFIEVTLHD
ncbi:MAG: hypothetical protein AB7F50_01600 [Fimbriimonadaceae bacterium]